MKRAQLNETSHLMKFNHIDKTFATHPVFAGFSHIFEQGKSRRQPIIMLTAKNAEEDVINGLTLGACPRMEARLRKIWIWPFSALLSVE
jgi:hypothetical protein